MTSLLLVKGFLSGKMVVPGAFELLLQLKDPSRKDCVGQCKKKLGAVVTADTWKDHHRKCGRELNENQAVTSKKARVDPYGKNQFSTCRICKSSGHRPGSNFCQGCAYSKASVQCVGKVLDSKNHK